MLTCRLIFFLILIEFAQDAGAANFTLTVTSGSGSGSYPAGTVVNISANGPQTGYTFDKWTGMAVASPL